MKNIVISGCSFVHGFDICYQEFNSNPNTWWHNWFESLTDQQRDYFNSVRLSGQLAKKLNVKVTDISLYGIPNEFICNKTIHYLETNKHITPDNSIIVIGWTENQRFSMFIEDERININPMSVSDYLECAKNMLNTDNSKYINIFEKLLTVEEIYKESPEVFTGSYITHLSQILQLQMYLESKDFQYCFFNSLTQIPVKPNIEQLVGYSLYDLVKWDNWVFDYWHSWQDLLTKNNLLTTSTCHPSIRSVDEFSDILTEYITNKNLLQ